MVQTDEHLLMIFIHLIDLTLHGTQLGEEEVEAVGDLAPSSVLLIPPRVDLLRGLLHRLEDQLGLLGGLGRRCDDHPNRAH